MPFVLSPICHHERVSPIQRPSRDEVTIFPIAAGFRAWLEENHDRVPALFIGFYKKGVAIEAMSYPEAVEEALCFGWIDGITYRLDDEVVATRFTPRRRTSVWSAINIAKVAELRAEGRMHPAGDRAFDERDPRNDQPPSSDRPMDLPAAWRVRLEADAEARRFWEAQPPGFRRQAADWVMSAKRPETRERRFTELLESASAGRRPRALQSA
jgi:uncharacterized protein YdeI (YjbR/CyaY-like superfamily)